MDELDEEILRLLSKRKDLVKEVGKLKESLDLPVFDKKREQEILNNLSKKARQLGLDIDYVSDIFSSIFQSSRIEQQKHMHTTKNNHTHAYYKEQQPHARTPQRTTTRTHTTRNNQIYMHVRQNQ